MERDSQKYPGDRGANVYEVRLSLKLKLSSFYCHHHYYLWFSTVSPDTHKYDYYKQSKNYNIPLRLHAASSVRIPTSTHSFRALLHTVRIRPLNLFSASSVDLHGA